MGVDLSSRHSDRQHFNWVTWTFFLDVAHKHGWEPTGTEPNPWIRAHWELGPEAKAEAIETWVADHREQIEKEWDGTYWTNEGQTVTADDAVNIADALETALPQFTAWKRQALDEFVSFLRRGEFEIW